MKKLGTKFVDKRFHVGEQVQVDYTDSDPTSSYKGPGTFKDYVTESTIGYEYCAGDHALVTVGDKTVPCCFPLKSLKRLYNPRKIVGVRKKLSYLTKRLMKDIAAGGIVIAPRRAGKTTAIIELMVKDPSYVMVCHTRDTAVYMTNELLARNVKNAEQRVLSKFESLRDRTVKVIIDEAFWNPAFNRTRGYHCAVSSAPNRMVVYNAKGRSMTVNATGEEVWTPTKP